MQVLKWPLSLEFHSKTQIKAAVGKHSACNPKIAWNNKPDLQTAYKIWITHVSCGKHACLQR